MQFAELTPIYNDHYTISEDGVAFNADINSLENPKFEPPASAPAAEPAPPGPPRGGTSGAVAPVVPVTGGRNPTAIPGDPGYRPASTGGGLLEDTRIPGDRY